MDKATQKILVIGIFALILLAGLVFAGYKIYQKIKLNSSIADDKDAIVANDLSFSESDYETMADRLYASMNTTLWTSNSSVVELINDLKTASDWHKLVTVFGIKESTALGSFSKGSLKTWLQDKLYASDLTVISDKLKSINVQF